MISHSEERRKLSPIMEQWLTGPMCRMDFSHWANKDLVVLWWDIAVFLHSRFGPKLEYLEETMESRGLDIPRKVDDLLRMVRDFI